MQQFSICEYAEKIFSLLIEYNNAKIVFFHFGFNDLIWTKTLFWFHTNIFIIKISLSIQLLTELVIRHHQIKMCKVKWW